MSFLGRYYNQLAAFVPLLEALILYFSVYLGVYLRIGSDPEQIYSHNIASIWPEALTFAIVMLLAMTGTGLYNQWLRERLEGIIVRLVLAFAAGTMVLVAIYYLFVDVGLGRGILALALMSSFIGVVILRAFMGKLLDEPQNLRRVLVLGTGRNAESIIHLRRRSDLLGLQIVGFVPVKQDVSRVPEERQLNPDDELSDWIARQSIDEVVVAPDERRQNLDMAQLMTCRASGLTVTDFNTFLERETGCLNLNNMTPGWFAFSNGVRSPLAGDRLKRLFDITASLVVLVLSSPLILGAALALWIESRGAAPILFRQRRVGLNGRVFDVYKFRSMCVDAEKPGEARWAEKNDPRVTRVGAVLRRFRIDELPQLFNVLRGEMSFVGPRPERPEFVDELAESCPHYSDRHRVKPGLTGWAQIRYAYGASKDDAFKKLQYDLYYVKNRNLFFDLVILLQTAEAVLWGRGVR